MTFWVYFSYNMCCWTYLLTSVHSDQKTHMHNNSVQQKL